MPQRRVSNLVKDSKTGIWNFRYEKDGKQKWKSLGTRSEREAERLAKPLRAELAARRHGVQIIEQKPLGPTWDEVVRAYEKDETRPDNPKTWSRYKTDLKRIGTFLSEIGLRPAQITVSSVIEFVTECRADELSTSSIKNALTAWNRCMDAARHAKLVDENPVEQYDRSRLRKDAQRMNPPLNGEFDRLLPELREALPTYELFVEFLHRTGCRATEALKARRSDVFRDERGDLRIHLHEGVKRDRPRAILLNSAEELLDRLPPSGRLFPGLAETISNVSSKWGAFFDKRRADEEAAAELESRPIDGWRLRRWRLHDHRHAFAINAIVEGADLYDLSAHLGHSSVKTTEIYLSEIERLPVAQRRSLRLTWTKGRRRVDPDADEQPEVKLSAEALRAMDEAAGEEPPAQAAMIRRNNRR